ncbi:MAG: hypothetical protein NVS2B16_33050 [Chloroflexota bacterium]
MRLDRATDQQNLNTHIAYIQGLRSARTLVEAGPFMSDNSQVVVVEVVDEVAARSMVARDPAVVRGVLRAEEAPWNIVFG